MHCKFFNINMFLWSNCKTQGERKQRQNAFMSKWVNYIKCTPSGDEVLWFQISRSSETVSSINSWNHLYNVLSQYDWWTDHKKPSDPRQSFLDQKEKNNYEERIIFLQFIKGLYSEFTFTWKMWPRTLEVLRCLRGNYMILWFWVSVTMVTGTMVNAHKHIALLYKIYTLISSRVAFQVLYFCLEIRWRR